MTKTTWETDGPLLLKAMHRHPSGAVHFIPDPEDAPRSGTSTASFLAEMRHYEVSLQHDTLRVAASMFRKRARSLGLGTAEGILTTYVADEIDQVADAVEKLIPD